MSSIISNGTTFHGIGVDGHGVFTNETTGWTYAGQHKDGYACGLGAFSSFDAGLTWPSGTKVYAEHGPELNGQCDGRWFGRLVDGRTVYSLFEHGRPKDRAYVSPKHGRCWYNGEACAPDDQRVLALIQQVAPVEVRP